MNQSPISKRLLIFVTVTSIAILLIIPFLYLFDHNTYVTFCNVGQGDATHIRIKNRIDVLIDAGPDRSVLNCLGKHMPFYDRQIEYAILSHPQKDHYGGFIYLADRYRIKNLLTINSPKPTKTYEKLLNNLKKKGIIISFPTSNTKLRIFASQFDFFWPPKDHFKSVNYQENNSSLIFQFQEHNKEILFTGDVDAKILNMLSGQSKNIDILKIPHHGSKNALSLKFLKLANPILSVISVGKNNPYGHPSIEVLEALKALGKKYLRTDIQGEYTFKISNYY